MLDINSISDKKIILFDGNCGLCNRSIKFVLRKEKTDELYFAALQSEFGKQILKHFDLEKVDTVVFVKNGKAFTKSSAALRICSYLKGLWPLMMGFIIVPAFLRDMVYDLIAENRIKWYGTAEYCEMMTPELKNRFLE